MTDFIGRDLVDRDDKAEMESHMLHRADDLVARGIDPQEARRIAEEEFGNLDHIAAQVRAVKKATHRRKTLKDRFDMVRQDLSFAFRQFRRAPGFAAVALVTLMLGVGGTVTIVTVVRAVVLDPLPFAEPQNVAIVHSVTPNGGNFSVSEMAFLEWRDQATQLVAVEAYKGRAATLRSPGEPTSITRGYVSAGFFALLGGGVERGREFSPEEAAPGAALPVALITHAFWTERFAGASDVVGKSVNLDGEVFDIVGVLDSSMELLFRGLPVITPLAASRASDPDEHDLGVIARLRDGRTREQAAEELIAITTRLNTQTGTDDGWTVRVTSAVEDMVGANTQRAGWVLLFAAGLLLATACLNVSNLLLARASVRKVEIGIRAALGAGRRRILGQVLTESAALSVLGGVVGVGLTALALPVVRALGAGRVPRLEHAVFDPSVLLVTAVAVVGATLAFGSAPMLAMRGSRLLTTNSRGSTGQGTGARRMLVIAQIAVSLVLLIGTGLLTRSFLALSSIDPGFEPTGAVAVSISMPPTNYPAADRVRLVEAMVSSVEAIPSVQRAGATATDPFSGSDLGNQVAREDRLPEREQDFTTISWRIVTPGLFEAMGVELVAGRFFENSDLDALAEQERAPVLIGERLATMMYGSPGDALGNVLVWGSLDGTRMQILGVVDDLIDVDLAADPAPMLYQLYARIPWVNMTIIARMRPGASEIGNQLREAVKATAPGLPVPEVRLLEATLDRTLAEPRFNFVLLAAFAVVGLALAVVGLYGLTAFEVQQRFREIGIRLSLGARPEVIQNMILREKFVLGAIGVGVGLGVAILASTYLESLLFGITVRDPYTWGGVVLLLAMTVGVAGYLPARHATRVDPREVLRGE